MEPSEGFPPIARGDARLLILGSLPGQRSINEQQYYAHPQNAFWRIMAELFSVTGSYDERCEQLRQNRVAVWDVLGSSVRPGSMDTDIKMDSARPNDFAAFFANHPEIRLVGFNGKKAEQLFHRFVELPDGVGCIGLPSTSPAYASLGFSGKLEAWRKALTTTHGR